MELIGLNAAYKSILDRCINTALFMSFGIGDTENLWQLRQFIGLYSVQQMAMNIEEGNILMGSGVLGGGYTRVYAVYQPPGLFDSVYSPQ